MTDEVGITCTLVTLFYIIYIQIHILNAYHNVGTPQHLLVPIQELSLESVQHQTNDSSKNKNKSWSLYGNWIQFYRVKIP